MSIQRALCGEADRGEGAGVARLGEAQAQAHHRREPPSGSARSHRAWNRRPRAVLALICAVIARLVTACTADDPAPVPRPPWRWATSRRSCSRADHLDCSAAESGSGRGSRPWNSHADVTAHGSFLPGEQLLLRRGSLCHGRLTPDGSGTNGAPIVFEAYGTGAVPVVSGDGTGPNRGSAWRVQRSSHEPFVTVSGFVTRGVFVDVAPPVGPLRCRVVQVGGDADGRPSAPVRANSRWVSGSR